MTYLVTGAAGFIGYHVAARLLDDGHDVVGVDDLNAYYDVRLKQDRLRQLVGRPRFQFQRLDIGDSDAVRALFQGIPFTTVVHLAAQAGVRYSLRQPGTYAHSNLVGQLNVLEGCRHTGVAHLVYASSSSVYGLNAKVPFSEDDPTDHPVSLYAATKRAGELMAHTYSHLYGLPTTGLRFFTVYGPWGRPDMAYYKFAEAIVANRPIEVYGGKEQKRDFTFIDDVVEAVARLVDRFPWVLPGANRPAGDSNGRGTPSRVLNVGNRTPVSLPDFIDLLERSLGRATIRQEVGPQPGDVLVTAADTRALQAAVEYTPSTSLADGLQRFAGWFLEYHGHAPRP